MATIADAKDALIYPYDKRSKAITSGGAPRKRRKIFFQGKAQQNSLEFLTSRGEVLRESSMADA